MGLLAFLSLFLTASVSGKECDSLRALIHASLSERYIQEYYRGKRLEVMLRNATLKRLEYQWSFVDEPPGILSGVIISIPSAEHACVEIEVRLKKRSATDYFNPNQSWDFEMVKRNRISSVSIASY